MNQETSIPLPFTIDKGVPMPSKWLDGRRKTGIADQLRALEIGESFACPKKMRGVVTTTSRTRSVNIRVLIRAIGNDQIRVWRIEPPKEEGTL